MIFSIKSYDNLICISYFGSVSYIQCIVIKPPSKSINFPLTKITIRVIESLGNFKFFLEDLFTFFKWINNQGVPYSNACYKLLFILYNWPRKYKKKKKL